MLGSDEREVDVLELVGPQRAHARYGRDENPETAPQRSRTPIRRLIGPKTAFRPVRSEYPLSLLDGSSSSITFIFKSTIADTSGPLGIRVETVWFGQNQE